MTETQTVDLVAGFVKRLGAAMRRWVRVAGPASAAIVVAVCVTAFWWDKI